MLSTAKLIVFEGPDKVGKETQSKMLVQSLKESGYYAVRVEPAKEAHPWGRRLIYWMLQSGWAKRLPNTFQFVQFLNKVFFQATRLSKLMKAYDYVILDRWALSGYVYGAAENINGTLNLWMYRKLRRADVTLVLSGMSYKRGTSLTDDSYEKDTRLQELVKDLYARTSRFRHDHELVDNTGSLQEVQDRVLGLVVPRCPVCNVSDILGCDMAAHVAGSR